MATKSTEIHEREDNADDFFLCLLVYFLANGRRRLEAHLFYMTYIFAIHE